MTLNYRDQAIYLLAKGFSVDFKDRVLQSDRFTELLMEMADEFVGENIPVRGEENRTDLAFELVNRISVTSVDEN